MGLEQGDGGETKWVATVTGVNDGVAGGWKIEVG